MRTTRTSHIAKKEKKNGADVGRLLSRIPLLEETEGRSVFSDHHVYLIISPINPNQAISWPDLFLFTPTVGYQYRGNSPGEPEVKH